MWSKDSLVLSVAFVFCSHEATAEKLEKPPSWWQREIARKATTYASEKIDFFR